MTHLRFLFVAVALNAGGDLKNIEKLEHNVLCIECSRILEESADSKALVNLTKLKIKLMSTPMFDDVI